MAPLQSAKTYFNSTSGSLAFSSNVTAGSVIVVALMGYSSASTITISDTRSNTYTRVGTLTTGGDGALWLDCWVATVASSGSCTVQYSSLLTPYLSLMIAEYGDMATSSFVDQSVVATGSSTTPSSGNTSTTTNANDVLFGLMVSMAGSNVSITAGTSYTIRQEYEDGSSYMHGAIEDRDVSSTGAYSAGFTLGSSQGWICRVVALKKAGTSPVTVSLNAATISASPQTVTPSSTGPVTVSLNAATITAAPQAVTPSVASNTITVTSPVSYRVFQRSGTTGSIAISGTYTGTPTSIEASFNGGAYATIVASPSGGTFSGTLSSQAQGQGTLTVRFTNDTGASVSVTYVGIGDVFVIAGQSNNVGQAESLQSYSHATLRAGLFGNDYVWKQLADPFDSQTSQVDTISSDSLAYGSWIPPFATLFLAGRSVPVAFVPCALGGSRITEWLPGTNHQNRSTLYGSMVYRALQTGCKAVLMWEGESDVIDGMARSTFAGHMDTIANAINSDLSVSTVWCKLEDLSAWYAGFDESTINLAIGDGITNNANILEGPDFSTYSWGGAHYPAAYADDVAQEWYDALDALFYSVTVTLNAATITAAPQTVTPSAVAAVTVSLNAATITAAPQTVTRVPGAVSISLSSATISAAPQTVTRVPGAVTVSLGAATITTGPQTVTRVPGAVTISLSSATMSAAPQTVTRVPGAVSVIVGAATITAGAQTITPSLGGAPQTVSLGAATISAGPQTITPAPGAVSITLSSAAISAAAQAVTVSAPTPGSVIVTLNAAAITAAPQTVTRVPGAVSISLSAAALAAQPQPVSIGSVTIVSLASAVISASPQSAPILPGAIAIVLAAAGVIAQAGTVAVLGGVQISSLEFVLEQRSITFTLKQRLLEFTLEE